MIFLLALFLAFLPGEARARVYDLYRADYPKGAFCEAIGAACVADIDVVNSFFQNPAVLASGHADWDFDGDFAAKDNLEPGMASGNAVTEYVTDGGIAFSAGNFGFGASYLLQQDTVSGPISIYDDNGAPFKTKRSAKASLQQISVPLALRISPRWSVGITPIFLSHRQSLGIDASTDKTANDPSSTAFGLTLGALYSASKRAHVGSWLRIPTTLYERMSFSANVASTSIAYDEKFALRYPWIWALGFAYDASRDTSLFLENDLIGTSDQGYLLSYDTLSSAVGDKNLVPKGRHVTAEPHWGLRERLSSRYTLHLGGYYESSRWEGYSGRLHTTAGLSAKVAGFLEVIAGADVAPKFTQLLFTFR